MLRASKARWRTRNGLSYSLKVLPVADKRCRYCIYIQYRSLMPLWRRLNCAQGAADGEWRMGASDDKWALRMRRRVREAVELLARGWPDECSTGVVEWLLLR